MIQSILSNLAIILLMHLCINLVFHYKDKFPELIGKIIINLIGSAAIISMFYLPIRYGDFFLDLRLVPLLLFALLRGWKSVIPILVIASIWRLLMGGPGAVPGVVFGMMLPTLIGLLFYHGEISTFHFKRIFLAASLAWIVSDVPTIYFLQMPMEQTTKFFVCRFLSIMISSFILYVFIISSYKQVDLQIRLNFLAEHDHLTGLYNKRKFLQTVKEKMDRNNEHYFLAILDLDFFKSINDKYGHLTGDKVLIQFANILKAKENDNIVFARFGGEEFIGFFKGKNLEDAVHFYEGIRKELLHTEFYTVIEERIPQISVSIGVNNLNSSEDLFKQIDETDKILYEAKNQGRNRVVYACLTSEKMVVQS